MRHLNQLEKLYVKGNQAGRLGLSWTNFYRQFQRQATQSYASAWGGADVALVSQCPQATASTLVRLRTELGVVEAETVGRRGVAARPPPRQQPTRRLARPSRPAQVTTCVGAGRLQAGSRRNGGRHSDLSGTNLTAGL